MLAKEVKIKNIKRQREFIKRQLKKLLEHPSKDGDTAYRYVGYVFPEVSSYFEDEGYVVKRLDSDRILAATNGSPMFLFTIGNQIILTKEELEEAEAVEVKFEEDNEEKDASESFCGIIASMLSDQ